MVLLSNLPPSPAKGMGMARAPSCEGVPRIALGDLEDGTHGQPDPRKLRHRRSIGGFAQNMNEKKSQMWDLISILSCNILTITQRLLSIR